MREYDCLIFDLYNTVIDDNGFVEREKYRIDSIYTILEKSLYPVKFNELAERYGQMTVYTAEYYEETGLCLSPFGQVDYLLNTVNVHDIIVFKKVYDVFVDAVMQISPEPVKGMEKALEFAKERGKKIGLISNTGKTPGVILRLLMKEIGLYNYFDCMIFSDEVGYMKPDKRIFDIAIDHLGVERDNAIFIGDLQGVDHDGAVSAGLHGHLFSKTRENMFEVVVNYCGGY